MNANLRCLLAELRLELNLPYLSGMSGGGAAILVGAYIAASPTLQRKIAVTIDPDEIGDYPSINRDPVGYLFGRRYCADPTDLAKTLRAVPCGARQAILDKWGWSEIHTVLWRQRLDYVADTVRENAGDVDGMRNFAKNAALDRKSVV